MFVYGHFLLKTEQIRSNSYVQHIALRGVAPSLCKSHVHPFSDPFKLISTKFKGAVLVIKIINYCVFASLKCCVENCFLWPQLGFCYMRLISNQVGTVHNTARDFFFNLTSMKVPWIIAVTVQLLYLSIVKFGTPHTRIFNIVRNILGIIVEV